MAEATDASIHRGESVGAAEPGFEEVVTAGASVSEEGQVVEQGVQGQVSTSSGQESAYCERYGPGVGDSRGQRQV